MTDAQIISLAITVLAIFGGVIYNNLRLGDVRDLLRAEIKAEVTGVRGDMTSVKAEMANLRGEMRAEMSIVRAELTVFKAETGARFDRVEAKIDKLGETLSTMLADEQRITLLERK